MSKSIGNTIAPIQIMQQFGAEILRLWVASVDYQSDVRASMDNFKQVSESYRKIRNTVRFLLGNLDQFDHTAHRVAFEDLPEADRFMRTKLDQLVGKVKKAYDAYDFMAVYQLLHNFCVLDLSSFYLDYTKDILYIEQADAPARRAVQTVMYDTVVTLLQLMAPVLPHTADEAWEFVPGVETASIFLTDLPEAVDVSEEGLALIAKWNAFLVFRDDVLKALEEARAEKLVGKTLEAKLELAPNEATKNLLATIDHLEQLLQVSHIDFVDSAERNYETTAITVLKADGEKCERCWTYSTELGQDPAHPTLCPRCTAVVNSL